MRNNIIALLVSVAVIFLFTYLLDGRLSHKTANPAVENFAFTDILKKPSTLHQQNNETILVHFWATWCAPCLAEFPDLVARVEDTQSVTLITISVDRDIKALEKFLKPYPKFKRIRYVFDPDRKIAAQFGIRRFPETLVLNRDFTLRQHIAGVADWSRFDFSR
jgi:cytochrome c biogenesis protein CcmG/thiol:disulfide interchange protein DsbE